MANVLDRDPGPEIVGPRITVYHLLPHLLDPGVTEVWLCDYYDLTPKQVAAARAYVLTHYAEVMARHAEIEERLRNAVNPPEVIEQTRYVRARFKLYREWFAARKQAASAAGPGGGDFPVFKEWAARFERNGSSGAAS